MAYNKLYKGEKNRVAIYVRVSTLHQIDKDSLPMQKQDLIAYAKLMLNTDDVVIFEDAGYSGKNTDRPKYQEMMSQIRNGAFSHLLVWKIDRISRNLLDFATMYQELKELGVVFVSKSEQFQTDSAMGEAMLKIILVFAELERNMTSERVTATMISRASNGQWNGGKIPFGYDWNSDTANFSINETESVLVSLMHDKYEEVRSLVSVARYLNDNGYRTRLGYLWSPTSIQIIFRSVFYCGDYRYNVNKDGDRAKTKSESEWVTVYDHHPAIISREQKERIINLLDTNRRMRAKTNLNQTSKRAHIFAGLMICGNCGKYMGASLAGAKKDWQYTKYTCTSRRMSSSYCDGKHTSDPVVGEFVFNYILNMLNAQRDFDKIPTPEKLQKHLLYGGPFVDIDHIESDGLNDLFHVLESGTVTGSIYGKGAKVKTAKKKVNSELSRLRNEKVKLERALDRLTNLYLYADDAMSDKEFILQKAKLTDAIDEINATIGFATSEEAEQSVTDHVFIQRASEFIIAQRLTNRNYIHYKRLALSVDSEVLKTFVQSIIENITMYSGRVQQITFKNGLSHTFVYKEKAQE